jgi:hypothetical protein
LHSLFETAYQAHPALAITAEAVLPVLGLLVLVLPATEWKAGRLKFPELFWFCALASIALVYILRYFCHPAGHWIRPGVNYSTHTAVAVSLGVSLVICRPMLLPAMVVVVGAYLWLITFLGYHTPGDAISTGAVILPLSVLCHLPWLLSNRRGR